ncbi:MAG: endonuclease III [Atopobium sp.]|uniref:endonuclease III n=1 Tax=Atopobium sp. TaxID=1872650 RepID=UPI002A7526CC|nr:endonuclease III [Atopobium sp.]MDY2788611.1 endonuclease III [Atopobium sp.]MDY4522762.1 endonuclease III [Atopobium sp.]
MPRESKKAKCERALIVCERMNQRYPAAECALHFTDPFTLVIAVLLSAQTTDKAVNSVTPTLFKKWPTAEAMAAASPVEVGDVIHRLGFFRTKSQHVVETAQKIMADFGGEVPRTMDELTSLPGVGRKTANIVLNNAFGIVEGIAVDTHVYRIATRLKLTNAPSPAAAEKDILAVIPRTMWGPVNHQWVLFGREICDAKKPLCAECPLNDICPSAFKAQGNPIKKRKTRQK